MSHLHVLPANLPAPLDDGAAAHLPGLRLPPVVLACTDGKHYALNDFSTPTVLVVYPMTGQLDQPLPTGWDTIPGARGCTPQLCSLRDHQPAWATLGVQLFGLSVQSPAEQLEAKHRLQLPFECLSDETGQLAQALALPTFCADQRTFYRRLTLICQQGRISQVMYPIFPPDQHVHQLLAFLQTHPFSS